MDYDRLKDFLDEDAEKCLEKLRNELETISDDKSDTIFEDCIHSIRAKILKEEDEILMRLSMADEEENKEEIIALTQQLMEIQKKRRN